jgi:hypothetical protein
VTTTVKVALEKQAHPERFCPFNHCVWRTSKRNPETGARDGGGYCPRHRPPEPKSAVLDWIHNGYQFPGKPAAEAKLP